MASPFAFLPNGYMTPEELDRTIEFVVRQQAQFSVDLQRDHEVLNRGIVQLQRMQIEMAIDHRRIAELIELQADRMDRYEKWQQQFQLETREAHHETLKRLDRILDKLAGSSPKSN
jgi:hypothetical protein